MASRCTLPLFLALIAVTSAAFFVQAEEASDVVVLDESNFDSVVGGQDAVLVEFYAPWCGHCKNLAPHYEVLGTSFAKTKGVKIAKVDADEHKELGSRFEVRGFPTLKWFPAGSLTAEEYVGGRTAEDLIAFVNGKMGTNVRVKKAPSAVVVLDPSNFDRIVMDPTKDVLVEFYAPWCGHCKALAPDYNKVASIYEGDESVVIANCDADAHSELGQRFGVSGFPTLMFFPKDNKAGEKYESGRSPQNFVDFLNMRTEAKRMLSGALLPEAGRLPVLDHMAKEFMGATEAKRKELIGQVEKTVAEQQASKTAPQYLRVMKKVLEKGEGYIATEFARLGRLLEGVMVPAKATEMGLRKNILGAFKGE
eukprot:jgi/Mesvir1/16271/Mv08515-RA.1